MLASTTWEGFKKASFDVRLYLAVACGASYAAECVQLELLTDDRFLKRSDEIWDEMVSELEYLHELPAYVWDRLGKLVGPTCESFELQHLLLRSSHISCGYIYADIYEQLTYYPLCLTQGNIEDNLRELDAFQGDIADEMTRNLKKCLGLGLPSLSPWVRPLLLLKDTPCSTNLVEEGHSSGACNLKQHDQFGERSLRARAMVHQCRALVGTSESDKRLEKLSKAVESLRNLVAQ